MDRMLSKHKKFLQSLPKSALRAIKDYTSFLYTDVNRYLRNGTIPDDIDRVKGVIEQMDGIFSALAPIKKPITLYRGISAESPADIKSDNAYISTTHKEFITELFAYDNCCIIEFTISPGSKVLFVESVSSFKDEGEVIIERGGSFITTAIDESVTPIRVYITFIPPISS